MATGTLKGLTPARKVGSGPDNKGLSTYAIATGYATSLGLGDPVKLTTDGTLVRATNDTADAIGVFAGVSYTDSEGSPQFKKMWTASTAATDVKALVTDDPFATFTAKADGPIPLVQKGDIFALNLTAPDTNTGRSTATVKALAEVTGDVDIDGSTDLPTDTDVTANDTFTIQTTNPANSAVTITFVASYDTVTLVADLNAVDGILATVDSTSGFLTIQATDGYDLTITEGTGTPFNDLFGVAAGTFTEVVAASAGMVKVINVKDTADYSLEVVLVDHDLRDDG